VYCSTSGADTCLLPETGPRLRKCVGGLGECSETSIAQREAPGVSQRCEVHTAQNKSTGKGTEVAMSAMGFGLRLFKRGRKPRSDSSWPSIKGTTVNPT